MPHAPQQQNAAGAAVQHQLRQLARRAAADDGCMERRQRGGSRGVSMAPRHGLLAAVCSASAAGGSGPGVAAGWRAAATAVVEQAGGADGAAAARQPCSSGTAAPSQHMAHALPLPNDWMLPPDRLACRAALCCAAGPGGAGGAQEAAQRDQGGHALRGGRQPGGARRLGEPVLTRLLTPAVWVGGTLLQAWPCAQQGPARSRPCPRLLPAVSPISPAFASPSPLCPQVIQKKKSEKPEARKASREAALR